MQQVIIIIDFGSQYTQLIARKVRELNVYCEIHPYNNLPKYNENTKGIILSGSPYSVRVANSPRIDYKALANRNPILGICYGAQLITETSEGDVQSGNSREYGRASLNIIDFNSTLFAGIKNDSQVWMSHADTIVKLPKNAKLSASTKEVENAAFEIKDENIFGLQFHPEVVHSEYGKQILENFVISICQCEADWTPQHFVQQSIDEIRAKVGDDQVVLGISGGVDSSVAGILLHRAIGTQLHCIFVNNGLLRSGEYEEVLDSYKSLGLNITGVDASKLFYYALSGISDPEAKRKAIGKTFIEVFDEAAKSIEKVKWLAQGTIYPDIIESVSVKGPSATIKSHHNVGGLPETMTLKVIEPLNTLFKDEVREVGAALGLPENILNRHPFPGPGLAIRILGDVTVEKVEILQKADKIFIDLLKQHNLYNKVWQAGAILLPVQSVGVMGDERTYERVIALRAVSSTDGMTADWCHLPYSFLAEVSTIIINQVHGINRVVYDISSKPPATIEWE
ncbi:MAG: glutamine-hydrolyzing GMP synthase [Bacteroidota bacterium]|nr:glutamine-hydrolyzing GMP synthase [Bacteroidota bacterium]